MVAGASPAGTHAGDEGHGDFAGLIHGLRREWGHRADGERAGCYGGAEERGVGFVNGHIDDIADRDGLGIDRAETLDAAAAEEVP